MKYLTDALLTTLFCTLSIAVFCAQSPFITKWNTENAGISNNTSITIPTHGSLIYNYEID